MPDQKKSLSRAAAASGTLEAAKLEPITPTRADRLKALEQEFDAKSERSVLPDRRVRLALKLANGDTIAGTGVDTEAALTHLESRVGHLRQEG